MQQERLDLQAWQTLEHSKRQHEHRPEPPDDERPVDAGGFPQGDRASEAQSPTQGVAALLPL